MSHHATDAYLRRLGLAGDLPPTLDTLRAIHRAHLEQVPYDNLEIMLGRPAPVAPDASLERVARTGRAGYCFHQNGALEGVLVDLGFSVERRHGAVWTRPEDRHRAELNHLVLVVTDLPTDINPRGRWWADVGLGEGFLEPLALVEGTADDGPFTFGLEGVGTGGWSFTHDPSGAFTGVEVRDLPVDDEVVAAAHARLSTPPDGAFTKILVVQRRDVGGVDAVRGCTSVRVDAAGRHVRDLTTFEEWRAGLEALGVATADLDGDELRALFDRQLVAHHAWDAAGRP